MNAPVRHVSAKALIAAFILMILLFGGMVWAALHHGTPVRFGLTPGAHAFGAARLLQYASPQYKTTLYDDNEVVLRALNNHLLDAALLPVADAVLLPAEYEIRGVFSVADLLVLSDEETVLDMQSLSGRALILPESLRDTTEEKMLLQLLKDAKTAGTELIYARNVAAAWHEPAGSVVFSTLDDLQLTLLIAPDLAVRFRLSSAWRDLYLSAPPAAYCVVARSESMGTSTFASFEKHVRDSMIYADRKRKKTIAMAVDAGIFKNETQADLLIDHISFTYHEGKDAEQALKAWQAL